jgi:hypothetical protein
LEHYGRTEGRTTFFTPCSLSSFIFTERAGPYLQAQLYWAAELWGGWPIEQGHLTIIFNVLFGFSIYERTDVAFFWYEYLRLTKHNFYLSNTQNTNKTQLLASNYSTFQALVVFEDFLPQNEPSTQLIDATSCVKM